MGYVQGFYTLLIWIVTKYCNASKLDEEQRKICFLVLYCLCLALKDELCKNKLFPSGSGLGI